MSKLIKLLRDQETELRSTAEAYQDYKKTAATPHTRPSRLAWPEPPATPSPARPVPSASPSPSPAASAAAGDRPPTPDDDVRVLSCSSAPLFPAAGHSNSHPAGPGTPCSASKPPEPRRSISEVVLPPGTFDAVGFQAAVEAIQVTSEHRDFWAAFAAWYPRDLAPWPPGAQFSVHWTPAQVTHFFSCVRLNAHTLASALGYPVGEVLTALLEGVAHHLLTVRWALLCPWCAFSLAEADDVAELPGTARCFLCEGTFEPDLATNVVVTCQLRPALHATHIRNLPCPLPPHMQRQYLGELVVGPEAPAEFEGHFELGEGQYVLCCMLTGRLAELRVEGAREPREQALFFVQPEGPGTLLQPSEVLAPPGALRIRVTNHLPATVSRFFLLPKAVREESLIGCSPCPPYLTALQVMHHPFWSDRLPLTLSLPLPSSLCTVVLLDVVSGPAGLADGTVQALLLQCIARHCGVMVGDQATADTLVASFLSPLQAVVAAIDAILTLHNSDLTAGVLLCGGLHAGPAAVEQHRGRLLVAGKEMARALQIHNCAGPGQLTVSQAAFTTPGFESGLRLLAKHGVIFTVEARRPPVEPQALHVVTVDVERSGLPRLDVAAWEDCPVPLLTWSARPTIQPAEGSTPPRPSPPPAPAPAPAPTPGAAPADGTIASYEQRLHAAEAALEAQLARTCSLLQETGPQTPTGHALGDGSARDVLVLADAELRARQRLLEEWAADRDEVFAAQVRGWHAVSEAHAGKFKNSYLARDVHQLHEELLEMEVRLDQARRGQWEAQYQWEEAATRLRGVEAELAAERAGAERLQTDAAAQEGLVRILEEKVCHLTGDLAAKDKTEQTLRAEVHRLAQAGLAPAGDAALEEVLPAALRLQTETVARLTRDNQALTATADLLRSELAAVRAELQLQQADAPPSTVPPVPSRSAQDDLRRSAEVDGLRSQLTELLRRRTELEAALAAAAAQRAEAEGAWQAREGQLRQDVADLTTALNCSLQRGSTLEAEVRRVTAEAEVEREQHRDTVRQYVTEASATADQSQTVARLKAALEASQKETEAREREVAAVQEQLDKQMARQEEKNRMTAALLAGLQRDLQLLQAQQSRDAANQPPEVQQEAEWRAEVAELRRWLITKTEQQHELERSVLTLSRELRQADEDAKEALRHSQRQSQALLEALERGGRREVELEGEVQRLMLFLIAEREVDRGAEGPRRPSQPDLVESLMRSVELEMQLKEMSVRYEEAVSALTAQRQAHQQRLDALYAEMGTVTKIGPTSELLEARRETLREVTQALEAKAAQLSRAEEALAAAEQAAREAAFALVNRTASADKAAADLAQRQAALADVEQAAAAKQLALDVATTTLELKAAELEQTSTALAEQTAALAAAQAALAATAADLQGASAALTDRKTTLEAVESVLTRNAAEVDAMGAALAEKAAALDAATATLAAKTAEVEAVAQALEGQRAAEAAVRAAVAEREAALAALDATLGERKALLETTEGTVVQRSEEVKVLEAAKAALEVAVEDLRQQTASLEEIGKAVAETRAALEAVAAPLAEKTAAVEEAGVQLAERQAALQRVAAEAAQQTAALQACDVALAERRAELDAAAAALEARRAELEEAGKALAERTAAVATLAAQEAAVRAAEAAVAEQTSALAALQTAAAEAQGALEVATASAATKGKEVEEKTAALESLSTSLAEKETGLAAVSADLAARTEDLRGLEVRLAETQAAQEAAETAVRTLEANAKELQEKSAALEEVTAALKANQATADTLAADIAAKTAQCHTTEAALAEKTAQLQAKSAELEEKIQQWSEALTELDRASSALADKEAALQRLGPRVAETQAELDRLQAAVAEKQAEGHAIEEAVAAKMATMESSTADLAAKVTELTTALSTRRAELAELDQRVAEREAALAQPTASPSADPPPAEPTAPEATAVEASASPPPPTAGGGPVSIPAEVADTAPPERREEPGASALAAVAEALEQKKGELEAVTASLATASATLEQTTQAVQEKSAVLAETIAALGQANTTLTGLAAEAQETRVAAEEARQQLEARRRDLDGVEKQLLQTAATLEEVVREHAERSAAVEALGTLLGQRRAEADGLAVELTARAKELEDTTAKLAERNAALTGVTVTLTERSTTLDHVIAALKEKEESLHHSTLLVTSSVTALDSLTTALAERSQQPSPGSLGPATEAIVGGEEWATMAAEVRRLREALEAARRFREAHLPQASAADGQLMLNHSQEEGGPDAGVAELAKLRAQLHESEAHRHQLHHAVLVTQALYDQMQEDKHCYTASLQAQILQLQAALEHQAAEREAERQWILQQTESDFRRLCERQALLAAEVQRLKSLSPAEVPVDDPSLVQKYRDYLEKDRREGEPDIAPSPAS